MRSFLKSTLEILNHPLNRRSKIKTILKLFWWKINQLFFKLPVLIEIYPNRKCVCYPNSSFGSLIVYTNRPEFMEMKLTELILKEDSVFFDVGSGIGDFSLIASGKIKKGTIFAFEPSKKPLKNLRENVAINFLHNKIKIFNQVVSDRTHINEFIDKADKHFYTAITDHVAEQRKQFQLEPIKVQSTDEEIEKGAPPTYEVPIVSDQSAFFG